jgi:hypothetical protein
MKQIPNNNETVNIEARKRHGRSVMLAVLLCLVVAATYLINAVAYGLSQRYPLSLDLTANAAYEIGPETKSLLGALDKDVDIYVLARPDSYGINSYFLQMQHIMELYPKMSGHVTLTYIDFAYDPTFASRFPAGGRSAHVGVPLRYDRRTDRGRSAYGQQRCRNEPVFHTACR